MAAEVVGGAFLSASLQVLFGRIDSIVDFVRRNKVDVGLLNKLEIMLLSVNRVLNDAEKKQVTDAAVRQWLEKLKDAIHNAEDLVDEINSEALRCEIEGESSGSRALFFQVRNFFSSRFAIKDVESRIMDILNTLEYIVEKKKHLGLSEGVETRPFQGSSAAALVKESDIYGRDADKETIIELLLSDEVNGDTVSVIPIVGMGGIGKTTLAQVIYKDIDDRVITKTKAFDIKAWITVSEESNVFTLTKTIFEAVTNSPNCTINETFQLQLKLKEFLAGKKFFFVLDDVWNVDYKCWYDLKSSFESAACGSKIIVTTRIIAIASMMASVQNQYHLKEISEEDCWQLFEKHAFYNVEPSVYLNLIEIGRQIVKKCKGLPLAVKSLGGLLRTVQDPKDWENVLKNDIWNLPKCDILPALWMSYYYLPPHLKRCFAYCSIFPKDYEFGKAELILLWMAQDLLQPQKTKILEEVGEEYFNDLISRSFFHGNEDGKYTMHDLVNDLAKFVSGESCLRLDDNYSDMLIRKTRHFSCMRYETHDIKKIKDLYENKILRTLLILDKSYEVRKKCLIHLEQLQSMQYLRVFSASIDLFMNEGPLMRKSFASIGNLKLLRYLDLSYAAVEEIPDTVCTLYNLQTLILYSCRSLTALPDSIDNLRHLRFLNLSFCLIGKIPDTICNLLELHTLILCFCVNLTRLPTNIAMLINLRCLDVSWTSLEAMPPQISNLKNLQRLEEFVVGKDSGSNIKELGKLKDLHGYFSSKRLENVVNICDVSEANLMDKKCITRLNLEWTGETDDSHEAREVLDRLQPHINLKELYIENYEGTSFPHWVGHQSFSSMKVVVLSYCKNCYLLPPLGQLPSLECLQILEFDMVERIGNEFYFHGSSSVTKPFQSLKTLKFIGMPEWKEWSLVEVQDNKEGTRIFSNVKELDLSNCPKLNEACLPDYLPSLASLHISTSHHLVASLSRCQYPSLHLLRIQYCPKMIAFPEVRLPSTIQTIEIWGCEGLVSLSEEGWPSDLKSLSISRCSKLFTHGAQWNLQMLTSLTSICISNIDEVVDLFGQEEEKLPTTLTSLMLRDLRNVKSLNGKAFQQLNSLQKLQINWCKQLQCLPEERLPASLSHLDISDCPLLKPRCQRGIGEDWPKIKHIHRIQVDHEDI